MNATIILVNNATSNTSGYITGAVVALLILAYLLYALVKPEKF